MKIATRKRTERANAELPKRMAPTRAGEGNTIGCRAAERLLWSIVGFLLVLNGAVSVDPQTDPATNNLLTHTVGNRLGRASQISNLPSQIGVSYNARDQLTSDSYDANGNTTLSLGVTAQPDVYDFDAARQRGDGVVQQSETAPNSVRGECARVPSGRSHEQDRLILRRRPDGSSVSLGYDADGLRVRKTVFDASSLLVSATGYLIDANNSTGFAQVVEEYRNTSAGTTATVYTYGNDLISRSVLAPGSTLPALAYFSYDGLGSVRALTSASGAVTDTYDYDAFGVLLARTGTTANAYLYRGEQFDADLGLYYLRARFMNPASGRFWNQDTFEGSTSDPASLHKYLYANGNPVTNFDPSGNFSLTELATTVTVASSLALIATPVVRPIVAQAVRAFSGDPSARFSLTSLGVFDESADLLDASGISLGEFSGNLFAEAFTQLGTDAVVGAAAAAGTVGVFKGFAAIRRIRTNNAAETSVSRTQIISRLGEVVDTTAIKALDSKALVGFRGSLARGFKGPHKGGAPFNAADFDVDAFIVSDKLAGTFPRAVRFRDAARAGLEDAQMNINSALRGYPEFQGLRSDPFTFRIFTTREIQKLQSAGDAQIFFTR